MKPIVRRLILLISLASTLSIMPRTSLATHLAGSDISYTCLGGNTYRVELTFYRDCAGSPAPLGVGIEFRSASCNQYFTDTLLRVVGTGGEITYPCATQVTSCEDSTSSIPGIQQFKYTGIVTLPMQCADWVFSWSYCCRNCDITTMVQQSPCVSGSNPGMYIETTLDNLNFACNSSPRFTNIPVSFVCLGQSFTFNHGVTDPDGDSLVYSLVNPMRNSTDSIPFVSGYSANNPITSVPALGINVNTGDITMTPTMLEVGVLSVLVREYRNGVLVGSVVRDMEIYVRPCTNNLPTESGMNGTNRRDTTICPGTQICFDIMSNDVDSGQIVTMTWNQAIAGATFSISGFPHPTGNFCWTSPLAAVGTQVYSFIVTVRDDACPNNGFQTFSYNISVSSPISSLNTMPISCNGDTDGASTVVLANPGSTHTYLWSPGGQTTQGISGQGPGTDSVLVTDQGTGCSARTSVTFTDPAVLTASSGVINQTCAGSNSGIAFTAASGGTPSYQYSWDTAPPTLNDTATGLAAGIYRVTITDSHGCIVTDSVTIQPTASAVLVAVDTISPMLNCYGDNTGFATVSASGGLPGYTYLWNTIPATSGQSISNVPAGTYIVTITDSVGCTGIDSVTITQPAAYILTGSSTPASCNASDGSVSVSVSGGTPFGFGYHYFWAVLGDTNSTVNNLPAGIYNVTVTDSNGCSLTQNVTLSNTSIPAPNAFAVQSVLCNGDTNGIAVVQSQGGTPPFTYLWNTPQANTTDTVTNLPPGVYIVRIEDSLGCIAFDTVQIFEPAPFSTTIFSSNINCAGDSTGIASAQLVTGGTMPYTYNWSPLGGTSSTASGLPAGTYTLLVSDINGCSNASQVTLTEPPAIVMTVNSIVQPSCYGSDDASIDISVSGGVGTYSYFWNPGGATTQDLSNIDAGIYIVSVSDNICTKQFSVNVNQPAPVNVNPGNDTAICAGSSIQLSAQLFSGQTGIWTTNGGATFVDNTDPGTIANNIQPGDNYLTWTVTDNGCTGSATITIHNFTSFVIFAGNDTAFCDVGTFQLNGIIYNNFTGNWTSTGISTFDDNSLPNAIVSQVDYGVDTLVWTITNNACVASDFLVLRVDEPVVADAGDYVYVCVNTAELNARNFTAGQGMWSVQFPGFAQIADSLSPATTVSSINSGKTVFLWTVQNGLCSSSDTVSVDFDTMCDLELPDAFSPNGDGFNDGYVIKGLEGYPENLFRVFNRWGNEVYNQSDYVNGQWIGQNTDQELLPEGTYFVILEVKSSSQRKSSFVDLRRYVGK